LAADRAPVATSPFQTSEPGIFAVGDVRSGSIKRVASAVGEGAVVVSAVHGYLAALHGMQGLASTRVAMNALRRPDAGEPEYDDLEARLATFPDIAVPTITLEGDANGAPRPDACTSATTFSGPYQHRVVTGGIGHNLPQEAPQGFAQAIVDVDKYFKGGSK
jgi:pimeloyl-ACP methyl ester carboxylesterase